jgi:hypothetical protein
VLDYAAIGSVAVQRCEEPIMTFSARRSPFVGRTRELETVLACLEEARGGGGGIALVAGESGIGKTRLLAEVARQAEALGWTVLSGRAYETADMPPYLPVTEALQEYLLGRSADDVALALGRAASEVARLLPELRALLPDLPDNPDLPVLSASQERYRLFAGIAAALLGIARATESGLLLILDDLQWADSSTLACCATPSARWPQHRSSWRWPTARLSRQSRRRCTTCWRTPAAAAPCTCRWAASTRRRQPRC